MPSPVFAKTPTTEAPIKNGGTHLRQTITAAESLAHCGEYHVAS